MLGNNVIKLNQATVVEALQEYFDKRGYGNKASFTVDSVKTTSMSFIEATVTGVEPDAD